MRSWYSVTGLVLTIGVASPAMSAEPSADDALTRMLAAYREVQTYAAKIKASLIIDDGRRSRGQWMTFETAWDANGSRLLIDRPQGSLAIDAGRLSLVMEPFPDRYLRTDQPSPLDYESIFNVFPQFEDPALPDVVLLLSSDPLAILSNWWPAEQVESVAADAAEDGTPRVTFRGQGHRVVLTLDPQTWLVTRAETTFDDGQVQLPPGHTLRQVFDIDIQTHNQPLPDDAFAVDAGNRQPVSQVAQLFGEQAPDAADGLAQPDEPPHRLIGQAAPPLALTVDGQNVSLADFEDEVIILDFWATWCLPCRHWMPQLQRIQNWARQQGKPVRVVGLSVDEPADVDKARAFWRDGGYTMTFALPVDAEGLTDAWGAERRNALGRPIGFMLPLPYTVVIHKGVVVDVHQGVGPQMREQLTAQIEALLRS